MTDARRLACAAWIAAAAAIVAIPSALDARQEPLWPGAVYDPAIPTLKQVVGHEPGEEITTPEQVGTYLRALAQAAPDRTRLVEYARSWEGRPLWLMAIGSQERMARLDAVKVDLARLADPRGLAAADADRLVVSLPVVVWLLHGVHGNEISSSDAALQEAYHVIAAKGDADVDAIRQHALVLIDPMQNPDGRARFLLQHRLGRAAAADPAPYNAEHDEPWPGGRSNHYLFDLNRDWFAQTQLETRGRVRIAREYWPHVNVDLHEQGGDNTYYFAPPADPLNPHLTKNQVDAFDLFGRANASRFDERGWPFFIREVYDSFYPGYGESWPLFHGSIGMTYEQASARGLSFRRSDGTVLTYRDGVMRHFNAAIVTAATAAKHREKLLREYLEYRRTAVAEGEKGPIREYVIVPGQDLSRADRLARALATQGIEVRRLEEPARAGAGEVPAGSYAVSNAQPAARLIRTLLDPETRQPADFIKRQEERRARRQRDQIYDITAWSLPQLWDVEVVTSAAVISARATRVPMEETAPAPARPIAPAKVGYLMPWGSAAAAAAVDALQRGLRLRVVGGAFTLNGRRYPIGTVLVRRAENPPDVHAALEALAAAHGVEIVPIDSTYVESGTALGSNDVKFLRAPSVLMAWDQPASSLSAGWARYTIERRFRQPVTIVRVSSLGRVPLADYDVLVLPSGSYATSIPEPVLARIKDWLRGGGTLVTLAEASRWAAGANVGLLSTTTLLRDGRADVPAAPGGGRGANGPGGEGASSAGGSGGGASGAAAFDYDKAIQPDRERPDPQPGAILRVTLDGDHWLSAGHDAEIQTLIEGDRVFAPIKLDHGRNVGVYAPKDRLIASGLIWPENQDLLVQKAYLIHQPFGQGHVIAFAEDANYRAFTESTMLLFMNAVLLGAAY